MTKEKDVLERIVEYENFLRANKDSRKNKRFKQDVMAFDNDLCANLLELERQFMSGEYASGLYMERYILIPQTRLIQVSQYKDRVAQQAIYGVLCHILEKHYIYDSYACRKGKGSLKAAQRVQYWLRQIYRKPDGANYVSGKIDAAKFFYRLDHDVIMNTLAQYIDDDALLKIIDNIINCKHTAFGLPEGKKCTEVAREDRLFDVGVPIGSLMSQTVANMVMNEVDQYAKHALKIHYYIRYMDDIIILAPNKETLQLWMNAIQTFMLQKLKLRCNNKTCVIPLSHGIPFVGKRIWATHILLRKSTVRHMKNSLKHLAYMYANWMVDLDYVLQVLASYFGLLEHVESYVLRCWIADNIVFCRESGVTS